MTMERLDDNDGWTKAGMGYFRIFTVLLCIVSIWFQFSEPGLMMIKFVNGLSHYTDWTLGSVPAPTFSQASSDWTTNRSLTQSRTLLPIFSIMVSLFLIASTLYFTKDTQLRRGLFVGGWLLRALLSLIGISGTFTLFYSATQIPLYISLSVFLIAIVLLSILPILLSIFLPYETKTSKQNT